MKTQHIKKIKPLNPNISLGGNGAGTGTGCAPEGKLN